MRIETRSATAVAEERMAFPLEQGAVEFREEKGRKVFTKIKGYASTWRYIEALGEEMVKGAFSKTIQERVPARRVKLIDAHADDSLAVLGTVTVAREDSYGLWVEAEVSEGERAQEVARLVDEKHLKWFSIGFRTIREEFVQKEGRDWPIRKILEAKLYEVSVVPFPADEECEIASVRSVVPFQDLPLAPADTPWDRAAAFARLVEESNKTAPKNDRLDLRKIRRAFAWSDRRYPDDIDSCKVQIADLVDGKLVVVPRAVLEADLTPLPEEARAAVREHLERYLEPIRAADPGAVAAWEDRGSLEGLALQCRSGVSDEAQKKRVLAILRALPDQVRQELTASLTAAPPPPGARTVDEQTAAEARARSIGLALNMGG